MLSDKDLWVMQEHYNDLLREAEQERLLRRVRKGMPREPNILSRSLGWMGQQLVHWGCLLEKHYSPWLEPACGNARRSSPTPTIASQRT